MSVRESVLQRIKVLLDTGRPAGVPESKRLRKRTLKKEFMPDVSFFPVEDEVSPIDFGGRAEKKPGGPVNILPGMVVHRELFVAVECTAYAGVSTTEDQATDPLTSWAVKALAGGSWTGVAIGASEVKTTFEYGQADVDYCQAEVLLKIVYKSRADDPEAQV